MVFNETDKRLHQGISILNNLDSNKAHSLINDICQVAKFGTNKSVFTEKEKDKLKSFLDMTDDDVDCLINTVTHIIGKISFNNAEPEETEAQIKKFDLDSEKVKIFSEVWSTHAKNIIRTLEEKSIHPKVTDITWSLDIEASSTIRAKEARPNVKLQLDLEEASCSNLTVQLNKEDLLNFYLTLENIQQKLDQLRSN